MKKLLIGITIVFLTLFTGTVQAAQWKIDPDHSAVRFDIKHIFSIVSGQFSEFEADLVFDPQNLSNARFDFSVNTKSINTSNGKRDTHLRSKDFFDADTFSVMTFKSSKITHVKENLYALEGTLVIKDVQQSITIEFYFYGPKAHPFDKKSNVAGFDTSFEINRLDFHVGDGKFYKMGVVGDIVTVRISVEALTGK